MNLIKIATVVSETVPANQIQIVARWKSTEKNLVSPANKARAVFLPSNIWNEQLSSDNKPLQLFLHDAIEELARTFLQSSCNESNMLRTEIPLESFQLANLLSWNNERAELSGRLSGDEIKNWISSSATIKSIESAHSKDIALAVGAQFVKLASPNHGLSPEKAGKILTTLWNSEDANSTTGLRVQLRLQAIRDRATVEANILDSIL